MEQFQYELLLEDENLNEQFPQALHQSDSVPIKYKSLTDNNKKDIQMNFLLYVVVFLS